MANDPLYRFIFTSLRIPVVRNFQPLLNLIVNVLHGLYRNAMCDAVLLSEAAGIYQSTFRLHIPERKAKVNTRSRSWFDLCKNVVAIQRNNSLAGASFRILPDLQTDF